MDLFRFVSLLLVLTSAACISPALPSGPEPSPGDMAHATSTIPDMSRDSLPVVELVPHLFVIATGEDLGPFAGWDLAYSVALNAYYRVDEYEVVYWESTNCSGVPWIPYLPVYQYLIDDNTHTIVAPMGKAVVLQSLSSGQALPLGPCSGGGGVPFVIACTQFVDTGIPATAHKREELVVRLVRQ